MFYMSRAFLASLVFICSCLSCRGQSRIDTDRPDQTESAFTVPRGWMQLESGTVKEKWETSPQKIYSYTLPTLLTKYGISDKWELRLITEYNRWGTAKRWFRDTIGILPVKLGFKVNLYEGKGIIPRVSLIYHTAFNRLASKMARGGSFLAPEFRFTFQNDLGEGVALGYNLGMEWEDTREKPAFIYTFAPGFDLGENWYGYVELFGSLTKNEPQQHAFDAGIAWYANDNLKLDASAAIGITGLMKYYIGMGCSLRFSVKKNKPISD